MKIILHIGAHRCATTSFQQYMRDNAERLAAQGVGFWGPGRTRTGLLRGLIPGPFAGVGRRDLTRRAVGRVRMNLARTAERGTDTLIISDENLIGGMRENLALADLYCGVGERMARFNQAFGGHVGTVAISTRSLAGYWPSVMGYALARGRGNWGPATIRRLAGARRTWRDVITDVACAMPDARLRVLPFETFAGRPDAQLRALAGGGDAPRTGAQAWLNATPRLPALRDMADPGIASLLPPGDGRWQPFDDAQQAALRETYADDMMWLAGGADGLATLADDPDRTITGASPDSHGQTRGRRHDRQESRMAGAR